MRKLWAVLMMLWVMPAVAADLPPEELVQSNADKVMTALNERKSEFEANPDKIYDLVEEILVPLVDFEAMSKLTLAKYWRTASDEQRARFMKAFQATLVRTYSKSLIEYSDKKVEVLPARPEDRIKRATVYSQIEVGGGKPPITVNYRMRLVDGNWKVYDLDIEGLSLVKNFRTTYGREVAQTSLQQLIERLEKKPDEATVEAAAS